MTRLKKKSGDRYDLGRPKVAPTGKMGIFVSATDESAFCDQNELGPPRTSVPTSEIEIFVSATDGCAFCDRDNLGRPMVAPTIKKDDRRNNEITSNL